MAAQLDPNVKDDLKTQFITREGTYRLMTLSEYSTNRPNRVGYTNSQGSPQVRVSIVTLPNPTSGSGLNGTPTLSNGPLLPGSTSHNGGGGGGGNGSGIGAADERMQLQSQYSVPATLDARLGAGMSMHSMMNGNGMDQNGLGSQYYGGDRICFNFGRELYVYAFRGVKKGSELSKPIDKKFYKGTNPSCHDFNATVASPSGAPLLVGFTTGQIQLVSPQPGPRELRKLYNEERLIDKTKVTCLKWLPNSPNLFLASHASGHLYLYNEELPCTPTSPNYQPFKMGDGFTILTCKSKSTRNPLYKWTFSTENCCINEFCFSPCGSNLAIVSQDGFLRVFHYDTMELLGIARSYFGGFLCVCWSPDGKYIVVGGEDDLVTVWSLHERRVVARGQGHRSWVSVVAFDPFTTSYTSWDGGDFSDDENQMSDYCGAARFSTDSTANGFDFTVNDKNSTPNHTRQRPQSASFRSDVSSSAALAPDKLAISYRLGSVGQDTQLCLWDITEDVLRHPLALRQRVNSINDSTTHMNGGIDADGVKLIRPIAIGKTNSSSYATSNPTSYSPTKDSANTTTENSNSSSKHSTNSSTSKFSTANCTISSQSPSTTPQDDAVANASLTTNHKGNSSNKTTGSSTIKFPNCISSAATKSDTVDSSNNSGSIKHSSSSSTTSGYNSSLSTGPTSNSSSKQQSNSGANRSSDSGLSALNSLTQRLTNFSFLSNNSSSSSSSDKKPSTLSFASDNNTTSHRNHRKSSSLLKSSNHSSLFGNSGTLDITGIGSNSTTNSFGSLKIGKSSTNSHSLAAAAAAASNAIVTSYDPMKLIGTSACPRFDECPLLEPLICKKIAHERLTALIFREDCFLTACQDGFIYTWARPGYTTAVPQHMSPSPSAPPGGTVV